jgi:hypothetical protein
MLPRMTSDRFPNKHNTRYEFLYPVIVTRQQGGAISPEESGERRLALTFYILNKTTSHCNRMVLIQFNINP